LPPRPGPCLLEVRGLGAAPCWQSPAATVATAEAA
jgi:hypothetical protein